MMQLLGIVALLSSTALGLALVAASRLAQRRPRAPVPIPTRPAPPCRRIVVLGGSRLESDLPSTALQFGPATGFSDALVRASPRDDLFANPAERLLRLLAELPAGSVALEWRHVSEAPEAFASAPEVVLLDHPEMNVDAALHTVVRDAARLSAASRVPMVVVTGASDLVRRIAVDGAASPLTLAEVRR